jgi:hypothetical protein
LQVSFIFILKLYCFICSYNQLFRSSSYEVRRCLIWYYAAGNFFPEKSIPESVNFVVLIFLRPLVYGFRQRLGSISTLAE